MSVNDQNKKRDCESRKSSKSNAGSKRKRNYKSNKFENKEYDKKEVSSTTNDVSWYLNDANIVLSAARVPFGNQLGAQVPYTADSLAYVPGICTLEMVIGPGVSGGGVDAVNISAQEIFQNIRKNLSTYATYAPADIMIYIMAVDEVFAMYNYIARFFGVVNNFSPINLYYPKAMCIALGMDEEGYNDFRGAMNDYRTKFNQLIYKAATLYMPTDYSVVTRHMWMFGNYFVDSKSPKAQTYAYVPAGFRRFNDTYNDNGSGLEFISMSNKSSMNEYLDLFDSMINKIRSSDSCLKIMADMRRAYETYSKWELAYIPETFIIYPIHDDMVLEQIMNTEILGHTYITSSDNLDIQQNVNKNTIEYNPQFAQTTTVSGNFKKIFDSGHTINTYHSDVTPELIVEITRNKFNCSVWDTDDGERIDITSCGADFCTKGQVHFYIADVDAVESYSFGTLLSEQTTLERAVIISALFAFDYIPIVYCSFDSNTYHPLIPYDNYSGISVEDLTVLNDAVMMSMWKVPEFRK